MLLKSMQLTFGFIISTSPSNIYMENAHNVFSLLYQRGR